MIIIAYIFILIVIHSAFIGYKFIQIVLLWTITLYIFIFILTYLIFIAYIFMQSVIHLPLHKRQEDKNTLPGKLEPYPECDVKHRSKKYTERKNRKKKQRGRVKTRTRNKPIGTYFCRNYSLRSTCCSLLKYRSSLPAA